MDVWTNLLLWLGCESSPSSHSTAATPTKAVVLRGDNDEDEAKKRDASGKKVRCQGETSKYIGMAKFNVKFRK